MNLTRFAMYRDIRANLSAPLQGRILGISGIDNFRSMIDLERCEIVDAQYPAVDMQELPFGDETFDCVISDQVLEHLTDPKRAIAEGFRVLKRDGIAIHTTCFLNPIHRYPNDYYRFSRDALIALCSPHADILHCGSWGSRLAVAILLFRDRTRGTDRFPDDPQRSSGGAPVYYRPTDRRHPETRDTLRAQFRSPNFGLPRRRHAAAGSCADACR